MQYARANPILPIKTLEQNASEKLARFSQDLWWFEPHNLFANHPWFR
jgi:hypothetical protein